MSSAKISNNYMLLTLCCIIFVCPSIITFLFNSLNFLSYQDSLWIFQIIGSITYLVIPLIIFILTKNTTLSDLKNNIPLNKLSIKNILLIILISFTMQPLLSLVASITNIYNENEISDVILEFCKLPYWQVLLTIAITPALIEEFIFRGIILSGYKNYNWLIGIFISSLYFGIIHLTISQLFYAIIGGMLFAFLVKATNSIWASVLAHFILNGTQITLTYISYNTFSDLNNTLTANQDLQNYNNLVYDNLSVLQVISSGIIFLITSPIFIFSIYLFSSYNKNELSKHINKNNIAPTNNLDNFLNNIFSISFFIILFIFLIYMSF